jgi:hypothetical protein
MVFDAVPATEWGLKRAVGASRRKRLLETPFDGIIQQIVSKAVLHGCRWKQMCKFPDASRVEISLLLPSQTVDLFHNGASGYRAQFYLGVQQGEAANRCFIDSLLPATERIYAARSELGSHWEFVRASLSHRDAKIWIREGAWLSDNRPSDRNLLVHRWRQNAGKITLAYRFEPSWAELTPASETCLELKGGCLDQFSQPLDVSLKLSRSRELHEHGYT